MPSLTEEQAKAYITKLLTAMSKAGGSDLFVSKDFPPAMKMQGTLQPLTNQKLTAEVTRDLANSLMNAKQREEFARDLECNFAISLPGVARFRVNVFMQQQNAGMVIRTIANEIPDFAKLGLPDTLKEIIMTKRGLVLVVGATGSGKSTSLAAMIDHRNRNSAGHIVTVVGSRHFGADDEVLAERAHALADAAGAELLAVEFDGPQRDARFVDASLWPDLRDGAIADAMLALVRHKGRPPRAAPMS